MVPDSAPWKDDGLENSDKNNYKCGLPNHLEQRTERARDARCTGKTNDIAHVHYNIDTSIIQTRTTEKRQRTPRVRYIQSFYRM